MRHIVREQRRRRAVVVVGIARDHMRRVFLLLAPHEQVASGTTSGERIERRLVRAFIKELRQGFFFGSSYIYCFTIDDLRNVRIRVVHVANQNRLGGTNDDARRLEAHVDPVRAKVALLRRVILGIDEDRVVRAGGHTRFTADADRFVEIDNAVVSFEHRGRGQAVTHGAARIDYSV